MTGYAVPLAPVIWVDGVVMAAVVDDPAVAEEVADVADVVAEADVALGVLV